MGGHPTKYARVSKATDEIYDVCDKDMIFYYINLVHRQDRAIEFQNEMHVLAIEPHQVLASVDPRGGFMGCTTSHLRALQMGLASGHRYVGVFEDDFMLVTKKDVKQLINQFWHKFPKANVLMLQLNPISTSRAPGMIGVQRVNQALSTAGYIVARDYIATMIASLKLSLFHQRPCGVGFCALQKRHNWYTFHPPVGKQRPSFSDIEQRHVNYGV